MSEPRSLQALPVLIQGGRGLSLSSWKLARAVARKGHLGVVSGTAIDRIVSLRLQEGDTGGHLRRAFDAFPDKHLADGVYYYWFKPKGLTKPGHYETIPQFGIDSPKHLLELTVLAAFSEVWLAGQDQAGPIGISLLQKIQAPTLPVLYGALLAGVDYVIMDAGIPRNPASIVEKLCKHQACSLTLRLEDGTLEELPFDPGQMSLKGEALPRPRMLAVAHSKLMGLILAKTPGIDGIILDDQSNGISLMEQESAVKGIHSNPPPGANVPGKYHPLSQLGKPFWLTDPGSHPAALVEAQSRGAVGIQVDTPFNFCSDSGMDPQLRKKVIVASLNGKAQFVSELRSSPLGFPVPILQLEGTEGERTPEKRQRQRCQHGYLRSPYRKENGAIGWRCSAELESAYVDKGGSANNCQHRRCLCSGLLAAEGYPHRMQDGSLELPLVTCNSPPKLECFLTNQEDYSAEDVIDHLEIPNGPEARV